MKNGMLTFVCAVGLTGCMTMTKPVALKDARPVPAERIFMHQSPPAGDHAAVVVTRDRGLVGGACALSLLSAGKDAAHLRPGETVTLWLPAGEQLLGVGHVQQGICGSNAERMRREFEVSIRPGEDRRYRMATDSGGGLFLTPVSI